MTRESFLTFYGKFVRKEILNTAAAKSTFTFDGNTPKSSGFGAAAKSSGAFSFKPTAGASAFSVGKGETEPGAVAAVKFGADATTGGASPGQGAKDHRTRLIAFYEKKIASASTFDVNAAGAGYVVKCLKQQCLGGPAAGPTPQPLPALAGLLGGRRLNDVVV